MLYLGCRSVPLWTRSNDSLLQNEGTQLLVILPLIITLCYDITRGVNFWANILKIICTPFLVLCITFMNVLLFSHIQIMQEIEKKQASSRVKIHTRHTHTKPWYFYPYGDFH